ncbi:MAG: NAD-dependent epimerase/dehydratase family protein [Vicinamibacterales bacterium]
MNVKRAALIGHTGFVGSSLLRQAPFAATFNRANIASIGAGQWDLVVCAAPSAVKWRANRFPDEDRAHVGALIEALGPIRCDRFVLISTVDVYPRPEGVDEGTAIDPADCMPYGRHRWELEQAVRTMFAERALIVRLSQLFGPGLRKNFVYDLIWDNALHLVDHRSRLQFYDVQRLWHDVERALAAGLDLLNIAAEPLSCDEIARESFGRHFDNEAAGGPVTYDMRSCRLGRIGIDAPYAMTRVEVLEGIRRFAADHQTEPPR